LSLSSDLKVFSGQKTVTAAGTVEALATGKPNEIRVKTVTIRAHVGNGGDVYVGDETVSSSVGYILSAGEVVTLEVDAEEWKQGLSINLSKIILDVGTSGEGVSYIGLRE